MSGDCHRGNRSGTGALSNPGDFGIRENRWTAASHRLRSRADLHTIRAKISNRADSAPADKQGANSAACQEAGKCARCIDTNREDMRHAQLRASGGTGRERYQIARGLRAEPVSRFGENDPEVGRIGTLLEFMRGEE